MVDALTLPKAELHVHIEGTLEPGLMFELARRNGIRLPYPDPDAVRRAYRFSSLQSFLDIYYQACAVLIAEQDFYELTRAYLTRAQAQGVRHAEVFFDPQTHTERGIDLGTVVGGITRALDEAGEWGFSSHLIMCFLRHLPAEAAMETLEQALPYRSAIVAVGLDSSEAGNPPRKFKAVYARASQEGFRAVAHAGEEGPADYIWQALDLLGVERVDHGVRCLEDRRLVQRLGVDRVPLTVCPFSNVRLCVVDRLEDHPLPAMLEHGLCVTINSDDPAYFGGYVGDNLAAVLSTLKLGEQAAIQLARNSFQASFLDDAVKARYQREIDDVLKLDAPTPTPTPTSESPSGRVRPGGDDAH